MNKFKKETKRQIEELIVHREKTEVILRKVVFDYCKQEGLVAASREFDINKPIAYKKIIREEFGLVI